MHFHAPRRSHKARGIPGKEKIMVTLKQYEQCLDTMWAAYLIANSDERRVKENIDAIQMAYVRIDKLKSDAALEQLLLDLPDIEEEKGIQMQTQCRAIQWIIVGIAFGILAMVAFGGCQTLGGVCRDIESAAQYGHKHIVVDE